MEGGKNQPPRKTEHQRAGKQPRTMQTRSATKGDKRANHQAAAPVWAPRMEVDGAHVERELPRPGRPEPPDVHEAFQRGRGQQYCFGRAQSLGLARVSHSMVCRIEHGNSHPVQRVGRRSLVLVAKIQKDRCGLFIDDTRIEFPLVGFILVGHRFTPTAGARAATARRA